jgi:ribonuclease HII
VVFERGYRNSKIRDSKQLTAAQREDLIDVIKKKALAWAVVAVGARRIERINILQASRLAMKLALERIRTVKPDIVLVDGNVPIATALPQRTVISGDALHVQISAASILAKVWRDHLMTDLDAKYPGYGFAWHFGYPTPEHQEAVRRLGPCRIHRRTFRGIRDFFPAVDEIADPNQPPLFPDDPQIVVDAGGGA